MFDYRIINLNFANPILTHFDKLFIKNIIIFHFSPTHFKLLKQKYILHSFLSIYNLNRQLKFLTHAQNLFQGNRKHFYIICMFCDKSSISFNLTYFTLKSSKGCANYLCHPIMSDSSVSAMHAHVKRQFCP